MDFAYEVFVTEGRKPLNAGSSIFSASGLWT